MRSIRLLVFVVFFGTTSHGALIDFDDGAVVVGSTLANQYASLGVSFSPGHTALGVPAPPNSTPFASNTDLTVVDSTGSDIGGGVDPPIAGLMLHSFNGWINEDGNPSFTISFQEPVIHLSVLFGGNDLGDSALCAVNSLDNVTATSFVGPGVTDTAVLDLAEPVTNFVVVLGAADDWVGVDRIEFSTIPEPSAVVAMISLSLLFLKRNRSGGCASSGWQSSIP